MQSQVMSPNFKPTSGELLMIQRIRADRTQPEQADRLSISLWAYRRMEKDLDDAPSVRLTLQEHEMLMLRRLRSRLTRANLAKKLKVSEVWIYRMETGQVACDRLREYWCKR